MNLYELAHHPDAYAERYSWTGKGFMNDEITTYPQFSMLALCDLSHTAHKHTDENEFRMHLLFVYFATTLESEWPA